MKTSSRNWIEAGKIIAKDATAKVVCPVCETEFLLVEDVAHPNEPDRFDRHMHCDGCGATEVLVRLKRP